jgi:threonine dehydrogenase-like Zn-dependent dehydrogenase
VQIAAAGVCHSDIRLADGELGAGKWPAVMGHEGAGDVEQVGDGMRHVAPFIQAAPARPVRKTTGRTAFRGTVSGKQTCRRLRGEETR